MQKQMCVAVVLLIATIVNAAPVEDERTLEKREQMYEGMSQVQPEDQGFFRNFRSSSNGKPTFIRFGKRAQPSFIRFGRAQPSFIRFGKRDQDQTSSE